jgi:CRP-like cAMP-binding protein
VTALKPTHCLVVSKYALHAMMRVYEDRLAAELFQLLKINELTNCFTYTVRKRMMKDFEKVCFARGRSIFEEEKDDAEFVYFVQSGELIISKSLLIQTKEKNTVIECPDTRFKIEKEDKYRTETVKLKIVGFGASVGEVDVLYNPKYMTTVHVLSTTAELYRIKKDFLQKWLNMGSGQ